MNIILYIYFLIAFAVVCSAQDGGECFGPNEFFDCGSACDTECATLGEPCPIVNIKCNEMCYCKKGFARNRYHVCIPIKQCPAKPKG